MSVNQDQKMWLWKDEPLSPSGSSAIDIDDNLLLFEDKPIDIQKTENELPEEHNENPTRAQMATKLLEELDEWIKEEPFSDWLEEKIDLPIFEELPSPECGQNKPTIYPLAHITTKTQQHLQHQHQHLETTQSLLQEFETILGDVGACHQIIPPASSTLTPPQSPPPNKLVHVDTRLLVTLQPAVQQTVVVPQQIYTPHENIYPSDPSTNLSPNVGSNPNPNPNPLPVPIPIIKATQSYMGQIAEQWNAENLSLAPLGGDVTSELEAVDEYVRSCVEDIPPASPCTSSGGSYMSSEDSTDDPDWNVDLSSPRGRHSSGASSVRNRRKPYSRPSVEDKKVRKKEQNKNAATRYRQKKKQEIKEILGEEQELADHNEKLQNQVKDLQREIGYLKGLMRDLFKAKGLIK